MTAKWGSGLRMSNGGHSEVHFPNIDSSRPSTRAVMSPHSIGLSHGNINRYSLASCTNNEMVGRQTGIVTQPRNRVCDDVIDALTT